MTKLLWEIEGEEIGNCNCDYGCPCQFYALPTDNTCRALAAVRIDRGYHGDTNLDGVVFAFAIDFPNPIHEGNGTHQVYIDDKASAAQRDAVYRIATGQDTEPMATHFAVYYEMSSNRLEPVVLPISCEIDIENATGRVIAGDMAEVNCIPIRNQVTNEVHRAQIHLPNGFEYTTAEMSSGTTRSTGGIPLELTDSYGQLNKFHTSSAGFIR
ncbi:MAG: DUF1326 domain-containing protein [Halioglobus sp.]